MAQILPSGPIGGLIVGAAAAVSIFSLVRVSRSYAAAAKEARAKSFDGCASKEAAALAGNSGGLTLFNADFCPFGLRAWIAILEKELDPHNPQLFEMIHCSYFSGPDKDPGTKALYSLGLKTVPAACHHGEVFTESTPLALFIDDAFPSPPLKPASPTMCYNMRRFMGSHGAIVGMFYKMIKDETKAFEGEMTALLGKFNEDLGMFDGPFLCGEQFTLADINLFGFIERIILVLPHYRGYTIPKELVRIFTWYESCKARPSVQVVIATRTASSQAAYCYEAISHKEYICEVYECYANDEVNVAKAKIGAGGRPGYNAYAAFKRQQAGKKE